MPRSSALKVKYRRRDLDQIHEDLEPENVHKRLRAATETDPEKPALGQHYCLPCDRACKLNPTLRWSLIGQPESDSTRESDLPVGSPPCARAHRRALKAHPSAYPDLPRATFAKPCPAPLLPRAPLAQSLCAAVTRRRPHARCVGYH
ncbi:hypothetical protein TcWFU_003938 [Taenia crassiceps]|uniref:Uncharacterized protein n=1 Tax=Taenia crassiceps TaxID=6207 RepID=A0ABR4QQG7_9CEST